MRKLQEGSYFPLGHCTHAAATMVRCLSGWAKVIRAEPVSLRVKLWVLVHENEIKELKARLREPLFERKDFPFEVTQMAACFSHSDEDVLVAAVYWDTFITEYRIVISA